MSSNLTSSAKVLNEFRSNIDIFIHTIYSIDQKSEVFWRNYVGLKLNTRQFSKAWAMIIVALCLMPAVFGQVSPYDIPTFHVNRERTGYQPETILTSAAMQGGTFGLLWNSALFDIVGGRPPHTYASLLYLENVTMSAGTYAGATFPVLIAAPSNDIVYAITAFSVTVGSTVVPAGTRLWSHSIGIPTGNTNLDNVYLGILGTPIVDNSLSPPRVYVDGVDSAAGHQVFALDITNGSVLPGWPISINNSTVTAVNQNGPSVFHMANAMSQRGALNLSPDGTQLYVPFGAYVDGGAGWTVEINTQTHAIVSAFSGAPSSSVNAGVWAPGGVAIDSTNGNVFATTGNGTSGISNKPGYWGNSLVAFNPGVVLALRGTYTPFNYCLMDNRDVDLGGGGPMLLPNLSSTGTTTPNLIVFGGKQGNVYLVDRDHLTGSLISRQPCGQNASLDTSLLPPGNQPQFGTRGPLNVFGPYSEFNNNNDYAKARSNPALWFSPDGTPYVFVSGSNKSGSSDTSVPPGIYRLKVVTSPGQPAYLQVDASESTVTFQTPGSPVVAGDVVWVLSANIVRSHQLSGGSKPFLVGFDATTLQKLYQSAPGLLFEGGKYNTPVIAHGTVFVGTDRIQAFGLGAVTPPGSPTINTFTASPSPLTPGQSVTLSWVTNGASSLSISGIGTVTGTSVTDSPIATTTYALTATNSNGSVTANVTVIVTGGWGNPPPPPIISVAACPPGAGTFIAPTTTSTFLESGGHCTPIGANPILTGVANAAPAAVYKNKLTGDLQNSALSEFTLTYTVPPIVGQTYTVRAHFADDISNAVGQRVFDLLINGVNLAPAIDIYALAGNVPFKAVVKDITGVVPDANGKIAITSHAITTSKHALISGIELISEPPPGPLAPTITSFYASPSSITLGQSTLLAWTVDDATSLSIDVIGPVSETPIEVAPLTTQTYTLTATNDVGSTTATATVIVTLPPPPPLPTIISFTASPVSITPGQGSTLSWNVSDALSLSIDSLGPVTGTSLGVTPAVTITYVLTATNAVGSVTKNITVTVTNFTPLSQKVAACPGGIGGGFIAPTTSATFSLGGGHCTSIAANPTVAGVPNAAPVAVYKNKWTGDVDNVPGDYTITFTVPPIPGQTYTIRTHFADDLSATRIFDLLINNLTIFPTLNIRVLAGNAYKAVVKDSTGIVPDANWKIIIKSHRITGNPLIDGVEIIPE